MYNQTSKYRRTLKTDPLHWLWHAGFFGEFVAEVAGRVVQKRGVHGVQGVVSSNLTAPTKIRLTAEIVSGDHPLGGLFLCYATGITLIRLPA